MTTLISEGTPKFPLEWVDIQSGLLPELFEVVLLLLDATTRYYCTGYYDGRCWRDHYSRLLPYWDPVIAWARLPNPKEIRIATITENPKTKGNQDDN